VQSAANIAGQSRATLLKKMLSPEDSQTEEMSPSSPNTLGLGKLHQLLITYEQVGGRVWNGRKLSPVAARLPNRTHLVLRLR